MLPWLLLQLIPNLAKSYFSPNLWKCVKSNIRQRPLPYMTPDRRLKKWSGNLVHVGCVTSSQNYRRNLLTLIGDIVFSRRQWRELAAFSCCPPHLAKMSRDEFGVHTTMNHTCATVILRVWGSHGRAYLTCSVEDFSLWRSERVAL